MRRFSFPTVWTLSVLLVAFLGRVGSVHAQPVTVRHPKAILFMLDGLRADALESADAPNIAKLRNGTWRKGYRGLWSRNGRTVPDAQPSSAANHAALATGTVAAKHGVSRNGLTASGRYDQWPTFLMRIVEAHPEMKTLFAYSWDENKDLGRHPRVRFLGQSDAANGVALPKIMSAPDAPDAVLYFIDMPDHFGHVTGFYPFGMGYLHAIHVVDGYVGAVLDAIASRPGFADEDWLIALTGDHGGYRQAHGMWGGHASTVPLIAAGRHLEAGRIPGAPHHYDLTATILAHFGFAVRALGIDGQVLGKAVPAAPRPSLKDGLAVYLPFDGGAANRVAGGPVAKTFGAVKPVKFGYLGGAFHFTGGTNGTNGVRIEGSEKLIPGKDGAFAATFWARLPKEQLGDPVLFGNKNWTAGINPGFALTAAKVTAGGFPQPGAAFNCGMRGAAKRLDLGAYHPLADVWTFYAVVRSADGILTFYHGGADGRLNWISDSAADLVPASGLPICLGQDGTGSYRFGLEGDLDEFALWTRGLSTEEVRRIFASGRQGLGLADLL